MSQTVSSLWWMTADISVSFWGLLEAGIRSWILLDGLLAVDWKSCKISFSWWSRKFYIPASWRAFAYDILGKMHERALLWTFSRSNCRYLVAGYVTHRVVTYLDFHSTKRALWLVDSWSRASGQIQMYSDRPRAHHNIITP